jgi:hypothetical protein
MNEERTGSRGGLSRFSPISPRAPNRTVLEKSPQVEGHVLRLSGSHAKLRREGYRSATTDDALDRFPKPSVESGEAPANGSRCSRGQPNNRPSRNPDREPSAMAPRSPPAEVSEAPLATPYEIPRDLASRTCLSTSKFKATAAFTR